MLVRDWTHDSFSFPSFLTTQQILYLLQTWFSKALFARFLFLLVLLQLLMLPFFIIIEPREDLINQYLMNDTYLVLVMACRFPSLPFFNKQKVFIELVELRKYYYHLGFLPMKKRMNYTKRVCTEVLEYSKCYKVWEVQLENFSCRKQQPRFRVCLNYTFIFGSYYLHPDFPSPPTYPLSTSQLPIISFFLQKYTRFAFQECISRLTYIYSRSISSELWNIVERYTSGLIYIFKRISLKN